MRLRVFKKFQPFVDMYFKVLQVIVNMLYYGNDNKNELQYLLWYQQHDHVCNFKSLQL